MCPTWGLIYIGYERWLKILQRFVTLVLMQSRNFQDGDDILCPYVGKTKVLTAKRQPLASGASSVYVADCGQNANGEIAPGIKFDSMVDEREELPNPSSD